MAVDFSKLANIKAGEAKKPEALPVDVYPGIIKSWEFGDKNINNTPYVRFHIQLTGEGAVTPLATLVELHIDPIKRVLRRDYFLTEDALWRLDEFLIGLGIDLTGRSYAAVLPETTGKLVQVDVGQYLNKTTNEIGNQINNIMAQ